MNRPSILFTAAALALTLIPTLASAQGSDAKLSETKANAHSDSHGYAFPPNYSEFVTKTYVLSNTYQQDDANEILIALRNVLQPWAKIYLEYSERTIVLSAPPDQQRIAQQLIAELDRPHGLYRLTFTLVDSDAGKRIGVQHFVMTVASGQRTTLKEGSKVPFAAVEPSGASAQAQFTYYDIGMNFDVTLDAFPNGLRLRSKVEQSSLADEHASGTVPNDPIVRQTVLEGASILTPGKPLTLGSLDVPGSTRHIDIEVIADPIP